jgi:hypothetical protein
MVYVKYETLFEVRSETGIELHTERTLQLYHSLPLQQPDHLLSISNTFNNY